MQQQPGVMGEHRLPSPGQRRVRVPAQESCSSSRVLLSLGAAPRFWDPGPATAAPGWHLGAHRSVQGLV